MNKEHKEKELDQKTTVVLAWVFSGIILIYFFYLVGGFVETNEEKYEECVETCLSEHRYSSEKQGSCKNICIEKYK